MLYHYHVVCRSRLRVFSPLSIRLGKTLSELRGLPNDRPRHRQTPSCLYRESCLPFFGVKLWFRYSIALRPHVVWAIVPFRTRAPSRHGFVDAHSKPCQAQWWVGRDLEGRERLWLLIHTGELITNHVYQGW
jgi:hypothetical protein